MKIIISKDIFMVMQMSINVLMLAVLALIIILVFLPDIFPFCSSCKRIKPRTAFKIHKPLSPIPGYSSNKSVCKKCCMKYGIYSLSEFKRLERIKKSVSLHVSLEKDKPPLKNHMD
ncbi:hypothetical protein [Anaerobacterium chartisolvens]|uniref:hypothetical protein n=1 Tax=Anaerobacterium chartisolvens TaxID=1297424 RepID=UPI001474DE79|nr:hypothetical protein [Anaerobacterium chartisolvens]